MHTWDPERYLCYSDERARPFGELVARIGAESPRRVVDLGCGTGELTGLLARRWRHAEVVGVDSSPEMVAAARARSPVSVRLRDVREWRSDEPVDVLLSNAALQWVPGHLGLLPDLLAQVAPTGWFAFSVPGNFDEPSHVIRRELAAEQPYAAHTADVAVPDAFAAEVYLERLTAPDCRVDAWETTYLHVLTGEDPVFTWVSGTGARPTLQALPDVLRATFEDELRSRLRAAYPPRRNGTVLPFRRVFVVAQTSESPPTDLGATVGGRP